MPTNKNAQLRYQILDRCFSNRHRKYSIYDLMDEVYEQSGGRVSLRTIRDDITYMRYDMGAEIEAKPLDGKMRYYRYKEASFSIFKNELSVEDLKNLRSTIDMLGNYRCNPANAWLEEVISKLECKLGMTANSESFVFFEQNDRLVGLEYLSVVIDATVNHHALNISYNSYNGKEIVCDVHPYYVKQYNNRWFLFGVINGREQITNFALDRIKRVTSADIQFVKNTRYDFSSYFDDVVGVSVPNNPRNKETIVLKFSPSRFPYVVSKPIHNSQQILDNDKCTLSIEVIPTRELEQQIFSFGADVEVLSPAPYRETIRKKIEGNLKKYIVVQNDCTEDTDLCKKSEL